MRATFLAISVVLLGCPPARVRPVESHVGAELAARTALEQFLDASEHRDFERVWRGLSADLRARYTPVRLQQDFGLEPLAPERLARARAGLLGAWQLTATTAELPLGTDRAVRLVLESDGWKVAALE